MRIEEELRIFYFSRNNNLNCKNCRINCIFFLYFSTGKFIFISLDSRFALNCSKVFTNEKNRKVIPFFLCCRCLKKER